MKKNMFIILMFSLSTCFAQKEGDKIILGGTGPNPPIPFKNNILYVNENNGLDSVDGTKYLNMPLYDLNQSSSTFWKDSISYTSNGYQVVNQRGEIIVPKLYTESFIDSGQYMPLSFQNSLFLNVKNNGTEKLFLFYGQHKFYYRLDIAPFNLVYDTLFSSYEFNPFNANIDLALISERNVILNETDSSQVGGLAACRHANGRDWWILKPGIYHNLFYRFLLSPFGIETNNFSTEASNERNLSIFYCHFSADGNRYAVLTDFPDKRVYLYDFDRSSGELSNLRTFNLNNLLYGTINKCCLSPDGSKMYFYRYPYLPDAGDIAIIQYDFETQQTYTIYQGGGLIPFTSPNGKEVIFLNSVIDNTAPFFGARIYVSLIKNPNEFGVGSDVTLNVYEVENAPGFVPPNHANFRLGASQGTVCDSLGLSSVAEPEPLTWQLFPNPSNGAVHLRLSQWPGGSYSLHNSLGQPVAQAALAATSHEQVFNLALPHLPNGLYFLSLRNQQGQVLGSRRLLILRE
jgi:hypothetical protein